MGRLTKHTHINGDPAIDYKGKTYPYWHEQYDALSILAHYEDLEEQGRLIELPCKVGDDVYFIPSKTNYELNVLNHYEENNRVYHQKIARITITKDHWYAECDKFVEYSLNRIFLDCFFGESWFLTKEEAEAKLKELKGEE